MATFSIKSSPASVIGPPPPFDPELVSVVEALTRTESPHGYRANTVHELRQPLSGAPMVTNDVLSRGGAYRVFERLVPGPGENPDVALLFCLPQHTPTPAPVVYFIHGGGMISGDNRLGVPEALELLEPLGMGLVSVGYRLAPEHPHPSPVEDCYAGLVWLQENAFEWGLDPKRVMVAGTSAGGGLAAGISLLARDRGGPSIAAQLLMSPMLDDRSDSASAQQMRGLGVWDAESNEIGWNALLGEDVRGGPNVSPYAAPARALDLSGLPPTYIDVGSAETFRDEDVDFARRLWQAGGRAELHVWPGGFHTFDMLSPTAALSQDAVAARASWLARQLR